MHADDDDLGLMNLRWPTPVEDELPPGEPPAGESATTPQRESMRDLLEEEIQQARANGTPLPPVGVAAPQPAVVPPPEVWMPQQPAPQPVPVAPPPQPPVRPISRRLFLTLQTIPDFDRVSRLRLPELPAMPDSCEYDSLPNPQDLVKSRKHGTTITNLIEKENPPREWLEALLVSELTVEPSKQRQKLIALCQERIGRFDQVQDAIADRIVVLSHVPEYAQVVGLAFSGGDGPVHSVVVGQETRNGDPVSERAVLALLWQSLQAVDCLVTWGNPWSLLYTRSCLVGLKPQMVRKLELEDLSSLVVGARGLGPDSLEDVCQVFDVETQPDPLPNQLLISDSWARQDFSGIQQSSQVRLNMLRRLWQKWEGFHVARHT